MNDTNVPFYGAADLTEPILAQLLQELPEMSPQLRKAAHYVLENPNDVGVSSIREIADAAAVKPNTLVRMARAVGYEGYEDFRQPFREELRAGRESFPDRARWLQSIARGGRHGGLYAEMAATTIANLEQLYSGTSAEEIKTAADLIVAAPVTFVLGVGLFHALAQNFAYLSRMGTDRVVPVPRDGSLPVDDLVKAGPDNVVLAMTVDPYRTEVIDGVRIAKEQGATIIALTDSRAAPVALMADHVFLISTDTPQFFNSAVAAAAFLETLMAFVIADADETMIANIEKVHRRRREIGVYWTDKS